MKTPRLKLFAGNYRHALVAIGVGTILIAGSGCGGSNPAPSGKAYRPAAEDAAPGGAESDEDSFVPDNSVSSSLMLRGAYVCGDYPTDGTILTGRGLNFGKGLNEGLERFKDIAYDAMNLSLWGIDEQKTSLVRSQLIAALKQERELLMTGVNQELVKMQTEFTEETAEYKRLHAENEAQEAKVDKALNDYYGRLGDAERAIFDKYYETRKKTLKDALDVGGIDLDLARQYASRAVEKMEALTAAEIRIKSDLTEILSNYPLFHDEDSLKRSIEYAPQRIKDAQERVLALDNATAWTISDLEKMTPSGVNFEIGIYGIGQGFNKGDIRSSRVSDKGARVDFSNRGGMSDQTIFAESNSKIVRIVLGAKNALDNKVLVELDKSTGAVISTDGLANQIRSQACAHLAGVEDGWIIHVFPGLDTRLKLNVNKVDAVKE